MTRLLDMEIDLYRAIQNECKKIYKNFFNDCNMKRELISKRTQLLKKKLKNLVCLRFKIRVIYTLRRVFYFVSEETSIKNFKVSQKCPYGAND